jgi:hypothetical protein
MPAENFQKIPPLLEMLDDLKSKICPLRLLFPNLLSHENFCVLKALKEITLT